MVPKRSWALLVVGLFVLLAALTTSCNMPMGLGEPIDWEPPVLSMDPEPNPKYVKTGATLQGDVSDNIQIESVIMRDAATGVKIFDAILTGTVKEARWEIALDFEDEVKYPDGEKISAEIIANDKMKNFSDVRAITLIIDRSPPVVEDIWIQRTQSKQAWLESYQSLFMLEETDPIGEENENVNRYQNGFFNIRARVAENETRIQIVSLNIYDTRWPNDALLVLPIEPGSFSPNWLVEETELIAEGVKRLSSYEDDYYNGNMRYYYRVDVVAKDSSENESESLIVEEEGYFCLWQKADEPKGFLDPLIGISDIIYVNKGQTLPVEFFDDDRLLWAYAGFLTLEQWNGGIQDGEGAGTKPINQNGDLIPAGTNEFKLTWLRNELRNNNTVYNWKYDRYHPSEYPNTQQEPIREIINGRNQDERLFYVQTGNQDNDNGAYVLFTLVADEKIAPHTGLGPKDTNRTMEKFRSYRVDVIDENAPLIVFDTVEVTKRDDGHLVSNIIGHLGSYPQEQKPEAQTGNSPEENTFPKLEAGRYFTINGYTLRANKAGMDNEIIKFRMAWIPAGMPDGADRYITAVQHALAADDYPASMTQFAGVQHWDFIPQAMSHLKQPGNADLIRGTDNPMSGDSGDFFRKQVFRKTFDVLGGPDDIKPEYNNFHYNGERENDVKLFVFYAEDNRTHVVNRQVRFLGNNRPPDLVIYDITGRESTENMPGNGVATAGNNNGNGGIPNMSIAPFNGYATEAYYTALKTYNTRPEVYAALKTIYNSIAVPEQTAPFKIYTRNTVLKLVAMSQNAGDIELESITVSDITFEENEGLFGGNGVTPGSHYNAADKSLTLCEYFPDEAQRVLLFTAKDKLGNIARAQRTISISNAAMLENITTTTQDGTYGEGHVIEIQANFSALVYVVGGGSQRNIMPQLNIRYPVHSPGYDSTPVVYRYQSIDCEPVPPGGSLSLKFRFRVPENADGRLLTIYDGIPMDIQVEGAGGSTAIAQTDRGDRPIRLQGGAKIMDLSREQAAFVPGYSDELGIITMPKWITVDRSLQDPNDGKDIRLDGVKPRIGTAVISGKETPNPAGSADYYFRGGDTISMTLTSLAGKPTGNTIRASTDPQPHLLYDFVDRNGDHWYHNWDYSRPNGNDSLIFTLPIDAEHIPYPDGMITAISLYTGGLDAGTIEDEVGNAVEEDSVSDLLAKARDGTNGGKDNLRIFVKRTAPDAPAATLNDALLTAANTATVYNSAPTLSIPVSPSSYTPPGEAAIAWENIRQYSLDGGLTWNDYTAPVEIGQNGTHRLRTRYVDMAGNEGAVSSRDIEVNNVFPRLLGVSVTQGNGTYTSVSGRNRLDFTFNFADNVIVGNAANVTITVADTTTATHDTGGTSPSYQMALQAATPNPNNNSTVTFTWNNITGKDMLNGLRITAVDLSGLTDRFGNAPGTVTVTTTAGSSSTINMPASGDQAAYSVSDNNLAGVIVSSIAPRVEAWVPANAAVITGSNVTSAVSSDNKTIAITFSKPVQRGRGTITVRPHGNFAIPAVLENAGYYLTVDLDTGVETRSSSAGANSTYVFGMNDIYNNMTSADRLLLITGGTLSDPALSAQTGLSAGPYKKMPHGLTTGAGYTGSYSDTVEGINAPSTTGTDYMIPDTTTKWVLDYQYQIHDTTANSTVANIRNALTSVGFRRQNVAVTSTSNVSFSADNKTVTITLNEPLLPGLQWDLFYPAGTFTDMAGNSATAIADSAYWFWSKGVQKPVIRVDRKSYDGRSNVPISTDGSTPNQSFNDAGAHSGSMSSFNTVAYCIETETPGARIFYGTQTGSDNSGSALGAWEGQIPANGYSRPNSISASGTGNPATGQFDLANLRWDGSQRTATLANSARKTDRNVTIGAWVRSNLVFRNYNGNAVSIPQTGTYTVTENGITVTQVVGGPRESNGSAATGTGDYGNNYYGLRSFNRDALFSELNGLTLSATTSETNNMYTNSFTYDPSGLQASKNYVAAEARIDHANASFAAATYTSQKGYEGVFRTVIALNQAAAPGWSSANNTRYILLCGTNVKSGIPTVAGFPVKDGVANQDTRYLKMFYITDGDGDGQQDQYYWVSTEIVTSWYMQSYKRGEDGGSYLRNGDATDWMTAGYGDLSYAYNVFSW